MRQRERSEIERGGSETDSRHIYLYVTLAYDVI